MKNIFCFFCFLLGIAAVLVVALIGISRAERAECLKWQRQAAQFPAFYISMWQAEQCAAHNITIDAPVK